MRVVFISLGCPKNAVETGYLSATLRKAGYEIVGGIEQADIAVVHTCSFIDKAREESQKTIKNLISLKKQTNLKVFATGCLPQLLKDNFLKQFPQIDGYLGTGELSKLPRLISGNFDIVNWKPGGLNNAKARILDRPYAYLKIAEGCNHSCSFCIIPSLRGKYRSRSMQSLVDETRALIDSGISEIILIAQDTTSYGIDLYKTFVLDKLLSKLAKIQNLKWIRILYGYPQNISSDLLKIISQEPKICKYLDIPIQHIGGKILSLMRRPANTRKIIEKISEKFPQIFLRTSVITGFPQENKEDINELLNFIRQGHFLYCGVFEYSDNESAPASKLEGKIGKNTVKERKILIENTQYEVFKSKIKQMKGKEIEIFAYDSRPAKNGAFTISARASFQAPEIDGKVILTGKTPLKTLSFYKAKIVSNEGYNIKALLRE